MIAIPLTALHVLSALPANSRSFSVQQVPHLTPRAKNGHAAYLKSLQKFKGSQDQIASVSSAARYASFTTYPEPYDEEYICPANVGGQAFVLNLDTGSSDL